MWWNHLLTKWWYCLGITRTTLMTLSHHLNHVITLPCCYLMRIIILSFWFCLHHILRIASLCHAYTGTVLCFNILFVPSSWMSIRLFKCSLVSCPRISRSPNPHDIMLFAIHHACHKELAYQVDVMVKAVSCKVVPCQLNVSCQIGVVSRPCHAWFMSC